MKVILIKNSKDGKVNEVLEFSDGYAKNFLIKNGFALPYNEATKLALDRQLSKNKNVADDLKEKATVQKNALEKIKLEFSLKVTKMVVHGSVTRKQILQQLQQSFNIRLDVHALEAVQIASLGITEVPIKLHKEVIAKLKVEVKNG